MAQRAAEIGSAYGHRECEPTIRLLEDATRKRHPCPSTAGRSGTARITRPSAGSAARWPMQDSSARSSTKSAGRSQSATCSDAAWLRESRQTCFGYKAFVRTDGRCPEGCRVLADKGLASGDHARGEARTPVDPVAAVVRPADKETAGRGASSIEVPVRRYPRQVDDAREDGGGTDDYDGSRDLPFEGRQLAPSSCGSVGGIRLPRQEGVSGGRVEVDSAGWCLMFC